MSEYPKHAAALTYALGAYHRHVEEVPLGSNRGPDVEHYQTFDWIPGGGYAWCIDLIQAAWAEGAQHPLPWATAGAYDLLARAMSAGWVVPIAEAIPGDPIIWHFGAGHGALLRERYDGSGIVKTVDGNVSDRVDVRDRPVAWLGGAIHVPEQPVKLPAVKPPTTHTVTSASGSVTKISPTGKQTVIQKGSPPPEKPDEQARLFWLWMRWRLGEGEFKNYGDRSLPHRPKELPVRIPQKWWAKARAFDHARKQVA